MAEITPPPAALSNQDHSSTPSKTGLGASDGSLPSPFRTPIPKQPSTSIPSVFHQYASTSDQFILRLRRLLTTTAGLEAFLSTINYALYVLAYLEARSPSRLVLLQRLFKLAGFPSTVSQHPASHSKLTKPRSPPPTSWKAFGSLISETRTTLRLTALLPLYAWLRELLADNRRQDRYLRAISLTQCISYIVYQFTENVAFLADQGVVSRAWLEKRGGSGSWWKWSNRAWLAGVSCDFLRLFRKALIERKKRLSLGQRSEEKTEGEREKQEAVERMWWSELFIASCWFPLCLHYSLQDGLKGVNTGVVGLLGFLAGAQSLMGQWAKTEIT